ncbi:MAG: phosphoribosylanthranilate isomerase [Planctomycetota bacterium]|jgi:phosphoribosylanthranilate isomerase
MLIVKVKICGITNYKDAQAAIDMGTDLLGFNFYPKSPRYLKPAKAKDIIQKLPAFIDTVGLFVNSPMDEIHEIVNLCRFDWVQTKLTLKMLKTISQMLFFLMHLTLTSMAGQE